MLWILDKISFKLVIDMKKIYIEAIPLVEPRPSGVGHSLAGLAAALATHNDLPYEIVLVAPKRALHELDKWPKLKQCSRKGMPVRMKILNGLIKYHLLPRVDWLVGRGVYIFGNFKNWPLSDSSKSITFIHDICYALHPEFVSPANQRFLENNIPYFMKRTNIIVTVSKQSKQEICSYYKLSPERVAVVYNGVDLAAYHKISGAQVARVKKQYHIDKPYFIYIGNIEPRKNLTRLIKAFSDMDGARMGKIALVLVGGSGWLNEDTNQLIDEQIKHGIHIIRPAKYVADEDVRVLISDAIALVQPSIHEGFSMPPLEALAAGTLAAVSNIPVHTEILGNNASYFDPYSEQSIKLALSAILNLRSEKIAERKKNGISRSHLFSWENSANQLVEVIKMIDA